MHLSLSALVDHLNGAFKQGRQGIHEIVGDVTQAVRNLEAKAEAVGNPLTLFESHGYGLEDAKRLVEVFENRAKQVVQEVESDLGLKLPPQNQVVNNEPPVLSNAVAGNASTETASDTASTQTSADPDAGSGVEGQQGGEGQ